MRHRRWVLAGGVVCGLVLPCLVANGHAAQLALHWKDNAKGNAGFRIERKAAPCADTSAPWVPVASLPAHLLEYTDDSLIQGKTYCYRVHAFNARGISAWSNTAEGVAHGGALAEANKPRDDHR